MIKSNISVTSLLLSSGTVLLQPTRATKRVRRLLHAGPELRNHLTCHMISSSAIKLLISDGIPRPVSGRVSAKGRSPEFSGFH